MAEGGEKEQMGDGIERLSRAVDGGGASEGTEEQAGEKRRRRIGRDCFLIVIRGGLTGGAYRTQKTA